ncbi:uncharacterized protein LOC109610335 isoform X2 [Camponotus floridanus]|uniref:uncharacterized protein LOC109610335 isoform X2 n=1 Tax=Camponotus floridanus TaxID=104421 RepID=UPI000DC69792|nr:uncharacterized protein LOC109610335 isoform X2 [Camponotus floridanus]
MSNNAIDKKKNEADDLQNISQDQIMDIILDRTHLKRQYSSTSDDSSGLTDQTKEKQTPSSKTDSKKAKSKKILNIDPPQEELLPKAVKSLSSTSNISLNQKRNLQNKISESEDNTVTNNLWYDRHNKGPYIVFVRKISEQKKRSTSIIEAARLLSKANIKFEEIDHHAWNTWKISFKSFHDANSSIKNKYIAELGLSLYIPKYKLCRKGVIKGIPNDISLDKLQATLEKDNPLIKINFLFRLKRRDPNTKKWIDSQSVCVEFKSQDLPKSLKIWKVNLFVQPYMTPVRRCYKCGKLGHTSKGCEQSHNICLNCGTTHLLSADIHYLFKKNPPTSWKAGLSYKIKDLLLRVTNSPDAELILDEILQLLNVRNNPQQTWLKPNDQFSFKGFDIIRKDRLHGRGGGVLILVKSNLKYSILNNIPDCQGNLEVCGIELFLKQGKMSIISLYRPPSSSRINSRSWRNFFANFRDKVLVGGDFNLPYDQIIPLEEGIIDLDITLLNDETPTFWDLERNHASKLDLSLISSSIVLETSWLINQDPWGSDHFPIFININISASLKSTIKTPSKLYSPKTDWPTFTENMKSDINNFLPDLLTIQDIQGLYTSFTSIIIKNITKASSRKYPPSQKNSCKDYTHSPYYKYQSKMTINHSSNNNLSSPKSPKITNKHKIPCPWWNEACDALILERRKALERFKTQRTRTNFLLYKKESAKIRIGLRNIKKENFKSFCENLSKNSDPTYVWRKGRAFKNKITQSEAKNCYNKQAIDTVSNLITSLFPPGTPSPPVSLPYKDYNVSLDNSFSLTELNYVLDHLNTRSSPGLDSIIK